MEQYKIDYINEHYKEMSISAMGRALHVSPYRISLYMRANSLIQDKSRIRSLINLDVYKKERKRVELGLEQQTNRIVIKLTGKERYLRRMMRNAGYIVDFYSRDTIYYTRATLRDANREQKAKQQ